MKKIHYAWLICFSSLLIIISTMGITGNAFTVYFPFIREQGGYYFTQMSFITTLRCLFSIVGMFLVTKYYKLFSLKKGLILICLLMVLSFVIYAFSNNIYMYYFATIITGLCYGLGSLIPLSILLNRWFEDRKALAIGICTMGTGFATIIFPPFVIYFVHHFGLQTAFLTEALILLLITIFISFSIKNSPEEKGLKPYTANIEFHNKNTRIQSKTFGLNKKELLLMIIALSILGGIAIPGPSHMAMLFAEKNFDSRIIAVLISLFGIALTIGKALCGYSTDKIGSVKTNNIFFIIISLGFILTSYGVLLSNLHIIFCGMILMGFGFPPATVGISVWAFDLSNSTTYPETLKIFQISYATGAMIFSTYPGIVADIFGSFIPVYFSYGLLSIIVLFIVQLLYSAKAKRNLSDKDTILYNNK